MTIGEKIKKLRQGKGWTRGQLAYKIDAHENGIFYWETNRVVPSIQNCILLADVFNVTLDELCCRGECNVKRS
jgi:DNA-binding XRE family transcriptional regulator